MTDRLELPNCGEDYIMELRKDKLRLDWLSDKNQNIGNVQLPKKCVWDHLDSLRGAIDAAMELKDGK
jgi:hypothetical protein